eukprot:TRINITY_DN807_c0_g1_i1.p1 TRINITY_DN807_c0_g1~~TRINITY_DN807_c0_g1_i1.p1  ORF type:complete len:159 (-),score=22.70 TRINITY_DN807_c0_g1_i1:7-441(-)
MAARRGGGGNTQTEVIQQVERRLRGECAETARALQWEIAYACIAGIVILGVVYFVGHPSDTSNGKEILDRLNKMNKHFEAQMNGLNASMQMRFDEKFAIVNKEFASMHSRFTTIDEKFAIVDKEFASMHNSFTDLKERFEIVHQ